MRYRTAAQVVMASLTGLITVLGLLSAPAAASGLRGDYVVASDGAYYQVNGYDTGRGTDRLVIYTPAWGASTRQNQWGAEAVVSEGRITRLTAPGTGGDAAIPAGGYVVSGHGAAASWMTAHLAAGQPVDLRKNAIMQTSRSVTFPITRTDPRPPFEFPGGRGENNLIVYTPQYGHPTTGTNQYGIEALAERQGDGYRVTAVGGNDSSIPGNGIAISGHGSAMSWIQQNVIIGTLLTLDQGTLRATTDASSYLFNAEQAIARASGALSKAQAAHADAALADAARALATARSQHAAAKKALDAGDPRTAIEKGDEAIATATTARQLTIESRALEARGVWHRPTERTTAEVNATVKAMHDAGFNQLYLETFWGGRTIYPSRVAEQNPTFRGFDPVAAFTAAARANGIELHLWMHTFFVGADGADAPSPVVRDHPDWAVQDHAGRTSSTTEAGYHFIDPAVPAARDWLLRLFKEATTSYPVAGLQLDYMRYPKQGTGLDTASSYNPITRAEFKAEHGTDPYDIKPDDALWKTWVHWKTDQVTGFARQVRRTLPDHIVISSALETSDNEKDITDFHQDFATWLKERLVDVAVPEVYTVGAAGVTAQTEHFVELTGTSAYATIGIAPSYMGSTPEEEVEQVVAVRAGAATGQSHFVWRTLSPEHRAALARSVYRRPAAEPQTDPLGATAKGADDMTRRIGGPYAPGLTVRARARLTAGTRKLGRDLRAHHTRQAARDVQRLREILAEPGIEDAVRQRLNSDVADIVRILDTAGPTGWPKS